MSTPRLPLGACVRGFAAWQFALLLREPLKRRIAELERSVRVHPEYIAQLRVGLAELEEAGDQWQAWRACVNETTQVVSTEVVPDSSEDVEIGPKEAAVMLKVTDSWARALLRNCVLPGRRVGRFWLVRRSAVLEYRDMPRGDVA